MYKPVDVHDRISIQYYNIMIAIDGSKNIDDSQEKLKIGNMKKIAPFGVPLRSTIVQVSQKLAEFSRSSF